MKFNTRLQEAILLRRVYKFMAEVTKDNYFKEIVYFPNLGELPKCELLGTRVWLCPSTDDGLLPSIELAEVDDGEMVALNSSRAKGLLVEAICQDKIDCMQGYQFIQTGDLSGESNLVDTVLKHQSANKLCYISAHLAPLGDSSGVAYCPSLDNNYIKNIIQLTNMAEQGHKARMFLLSSSSRCKDIFFNLDSSTSTIMQDALQAGVEVYSYKLDISNYYINVGEQLSTKLVATKT